MLMMGKVKCYSGHTFAQRPMSFLWQGREHNISHIEREWQEPGMRFFKVWTQENKVFELWYSDFRNEWSITELV